MNIKDIVATLEASGMPLNNEQREALIAEGKRKQRDLRTQVRDEVAAKFKFDSEAIKKAAIEASADAVQKILSAGVIEKIIQGLIMKHMPSGAHFATILKDQVVIAAGIVAKDTIANSVNITFNEAANYKEGGSF